MVDINMGPNSIQLPKMMIIITTTLIDLVKSMVLPYSIEFKFKFNFDLNSLLSYAQCQFRWCYERLVKKEE